MVWGGARAFLYFLFFICLDLVLTHSLLGVRCGLSMLFSFLFSFLFASFYFSSRTSCWFLGRSLSASAPLWLPSCYTSCLRGSSYSCSCLRYLSAHSFCSLYFLFSILCFFVLFLLFFVMISVFVSFRFAFLHYLCIPVLFLLFPSDLPTSPNFAPSTFHPPILTLTLLFLH